MNTKVGVASDGFMHDFVKSNVSIAKDKLA